MPLSSLNTGSTDLRDTEVQQPNTAATLSLTNSSRAFSANNGQFEAGSTTTGSICLPSSPPLALMSATSISIMSFRMVSLIAIVPDSEWRMPILMVSSAFAWFTPVPRMARTAAASESQRYRTVLMGAPVWFDDREHREAAPLLSVSASTLARQNEARREPLA